MFDTSKALWDHFSLEHFSSLNYVIGNTPMVKITYRFKGKVRSIFAKCEYFNLTGSVKDRMALHILRQAYAENSLKPGFRIVEASSGSTGISFAAIGRYTGHGITILMPDWVSIERSMLLKALGANVILVSAEQGGFQGCLRMAETMASNDSRIFLPRQFENPRNIECHKKTTGPEIWLQMKQEGLLPDIFVACVGTGGTVMGIARSMKLRNTAFRTYPIESFESPILTTGCKGGRHRIQGVLDEFIPPLFNSKELEKPIQVHDGDAILMAQQLARTLGLAVGISSGANFLGAVKANEAAGQGANVVTMFCDCNKKYLSTDLTKEEPVREGYLTPHIELLAYRPLGRFN